MSAEDALEAALRALRHRDLSAADLERRLGGRGFDEEERAVAVATLQRTGVLDDRRFAELRAAALAGRGAGDALIRHDLGRAGVDSELVEDAVRELEPERERVRRIVDRRGLDPKTIRYLASKGFADETVAALVDFGVVASGSADELG
jgi:regulatory protein